MIKIITRATVLTAAVALTAGASAGTAAASPSTDAIDWTACPQGSPAGYQCAMFEVPQSYRDPKGTKIRLALGRLPATDQVHKLGTIFYNPGGPGNSGRFAPPLTAELHRRFDIVGFDPRGVGASSTVQCFTDPAQLPPLLRSFGQFPITAEQERQQIEDVRTVTDLCARNAGPLLGHLSTANIARDLDRLRAAVGESHLRFYGLSYGSYLGEVYANLFGDRVGALALDAVNDPVNWTSGYRPWEAARPFSYRLDAYPDAQRALTAFLDACAASTHCAFREPGTDLLGKYERVLDRLARGPVAITDPGTGQPTQIRYQDVVSRTQDALTDAANSPALARFLQAVAQAPAAGTASAPVAPNPGITTPFDSAIGGGATVCSDSLNPHDPSVWGRYARHADLSGRGFGSYDVYKSLPCATWPGTDPDRYPGPWNRPTAAPILLVGNRQGDPATPYPGAQRAEKLLANARLLSLDSFGHGALGRSACIDHAIDRYFITGTLPPAGTLCQPDHAPFD